MNNPHEIAERIVIARTATSVDLKSRRCRICRTWKSLKFFPKDKNAPWAKGRKEMREECAKVALAHEKIHSGGPPCCGEEIAQKIRKLK